MNGIGNSSYFYSMTGYQNIAANAIKPRTVHAEPRSSRSSRYVEESEGEGSSYGGQVDTSTKESYTNLLVVLTARNMTARSGPTPLGKIPYHRDDF